MTKIMKFLGLAILIPIMVSCGGAKNAASNDDTMVRVALIDEGSGIDDKSFNAAAWRGITSYYGDEPGKETNRQQYYEEFFATTADQRIPQLRLASEEGYNLIVATGFTFQNDLNTVAPNYPELKFLFVDGSVNQPNVASAVFSEEEGSYLVGVIAALKAIEDGIPNPSFGFIGGMAGSVITRFHIGFIQGVKSVLPNAEVREYYANSWAAPELGKAQAKQWFDNGVYAVFSAAATTGNGAITLAKEYRAAGKNVWAIGVDSDQYDDGVYDSVNNLSAVLTSMVKKVEVPVYDAIKAVADGTFESGTKVYNLSNNGVGYADTNSVLSADIINKVEAAKQDIVSKKVVLVSVASEAIAKGIIPANTAARDDS